MFGNEKEYAAGERERANIKPTARVGNLRRDRKYPVSFYYPNSGRTINCLIAVDDMVKRLEGFTVYGYRNERGR